ncbi:MAG: TlpA family protein disulfide reductase [Mariniphaga sp.]|nr:TlpA family protein disulfide reductase [Mariniphaga sp.]
MFYFKTFILLSLISIQVNAQKSVLSGKAADYKTKEITFYTIPDPVLRQKLELASTKIAIDGTFSVALPISQTIEIYTDLEKYCGTMVVEPGENYTITLPPFSLRTSNEAHSSYFKPAPFWLGLPAGDNNDLNFAVRSFVVDFNSETVKNTVSIYQKQSKEVVNEIIGRLEAKYLANKNEYFKTLKNYYFAELEYAVNQRTPEFVIKKYFATEPVQLHHPIYQRAFETIFSDFLRKQSQDIQNREIVHLTNSGNYLKLVSLFESRGYKKEFAELVVLKGLNDGYYSNTFAKEGVMKAIEMAQTATISAILQPIAHQVKRKLSLLAVGGKAPELRLSNLKKSQVTLDQYRGKFIYLSFFNSKSSDCRAELDSIVSIEKRLRQVLTVVSVALDDDFDAAVKLWNSKGYKWELLNGSKQKQLIINYNASITPAFYLIDPDGALKLSQAPSPSHGLEPLFLKMFRDYNFKRQRN